MAKKHVSSRQTMILNSLLYNVFGFLFSLEAIRDFCIQPCLLRFCETQHRLLILFNANLVILFSCTPQHQSAFLFAEAYQGKEFKPFFNANGKILVHLNLLYYHRQSSSISYLFSTCSVVLASHFNKISYESSCNQNMLCSFARCMLFLESHAISLFAKAIAKL